MNTVTEYQLVMLRAKERGVEGMLAIYKNLGPFKGLLVLSRKGCGNKYFDIPSQASFNYEPQHLFAVSNGAVIKGAYYIENNELKQAFTADDTLGKEDKCKLVVASSKAGVGMFQMTVSFLENYAACAEFHVNHVRMATVAEMQQEVIDEDC